MVNVTHARRTEMPFGSYLNDLRAVWRDVAQRDGAHTRQYVMAGQTIAVETAGAGPGEGEFRAMEHLATSAEEAADLTIRLLEEADAGDALPEVPAALCTPTEDANSEGGAVHYFDSPTLRVSRQHGAHGTELTMLDKETHRGLVVSRRHPPYARTNAVHASPLRNILSWWLTSRDAVVAHGAAVGTRDGGVLLCGNGGSGKSTTAMLCVQAGLLYAGDDSVVLTGLRRPVVHSMYRSAGLRRGSVLPTADAGTHEGPFPSFRSSKDLILLSSHPGPVVTHFPLRAIVRLRVTDHQDTHVGPATGMEVLEALAPSTVCQFTGDAQERLDRLAAISAAVPSYTLALGHDVRQVAAGVQRILRDATPAGVTA